MSDDTVIVTGAKRRRAKTAASIGLLGLLAFLVTVSVAFGFGQGDPLGRYIVVLRNSVDSPAAIGRNQTEQYGGHLGFVYRYGPIGYSATLPRGAAQALEQDPRVRAVRPDQLSVAAAQTKPTGIKRVFALANNALKIDETANFTVDADVAVIDTGVDFEHPDLKVVKRTYCDGNETSATCTNEIGTDEHGHGTHVAGTIAAIDNTVGVVGVAPGARLWAVKVLDPGAWESEIVAGVNWVTARAEEIEVANMSLQCETMPCTLTTLKEAVVKSTEAGVVYVIAAGNKAKDAKGTTYATIPNTITVSALADYDGESGEKAGALWSPSCSKENEKEKEEKLGEDDKLATFSNFGKDVEMIAPGVCVYSTYKEGKYAYDSGTSMAAPHVAGAAAILAAQSNPNTLGDVEAINETLIEKGNLNWKDTSGDGAQERLLDVSDESTFK